MFNIILSQILHNRGKILKSSLKSRVIIFVKEKIDEKILETPEKAKHL